MSHEDKHIRLKSNMEHETGNAETGQFTAPHSHIPCGESGSGYYGSKVLDTNFCFKELVPIALDCVSSYPVTPGSVFTIADYGCADGASSMQLIYSCVEELKKLHGGELEICILYEDQPVNDFTSLFYFLQGLIPGPRSYLTTFPNVYVAACGTEFFKQCFPSGSINLGLCCIAIHWLSKLPCSLTDALFHFQAQSQDERELFTRQAAADWEMFLLMRAKELSSGGSLVMAVVAESDDGQLPGKTNNTKANSVYQALYEVWQKMAEDGVITMDEVNKTTVAGYTRTRKELQIPFMSGSSPVIKAGLSLVSLEIKTCPCPHTKMRQETGNVKMAAKSMADETRAWSNSTFLSGLSDQRTSEEKNKIVDELYRRLEAEFVKSPEGYQHEIVAAFIKVKKN